MELKPPEEYITQMESWEKFLFFSSSLQLTIFQGTEEDILTVDMDIPNKKVINNDSERSRHKERKMYTDFADVLKKFLSYYCKTNNIIYKQGMNEIASPFVFLYYYSSLPLPRAYNLFQFFLGLFLNNYYYHTEIEAITISISLVQLLLKYHEPALFSIFKVNSVLPEVYSANWLLTAFGTRLKIHMVYLFWNLMIQEQSSLFSFYFTIALLKYHKKAIIASAKEDSVYNYINSIMIETPDSLSEIYLEAKRIEGNTPKSFDLLVNKLQLFNPQCKVEKLKKVKEALKLQSMIALPIFPSEVLKLIYPRKIFCINRACDNFTSKESKGCSLCFLKRRIHFVIIDLRQLDAQKLKDHNITLLPMTLFYSSLEYPNAPNDILSHFSLYKERTHFVFFTSSTEYFAEFDLNLYQQEQMEKRDSMAGAKPKAEKEINQKNVNAFLSKNMDNLATNIRNLQEFDTLKTILDALTSNRIPYASFVLGGFQELHLMSLQNNISLINHETSKCELCLHQRKEKKEVVSEIDQLFSLDTSISNNPKKLFGESLELVFALYKGEVHEVFSCRIIAINDLTVEQKGYLIIDLRKICVYKIIQSQFKLDLVKNIEEGELVVFLENVSFSSIILIQRSKLTKEMVVIGYDNKTMIIDFLSEEKANDFIKTHRAYNFDMIAKGLM